MTITLYDIPSTLPGSAWSPNTYKTRISLNYKGLPYNTEWVEFPDIESFAKSIGALPTMKKKNGDDYYTLPIIKDSETGKVVSDSLAIAKYLDETYPDTPLLFPVGFGADAFFRYHIRHAFVRQLANLAVPLICDRLSPRGQAYFRETRERDWGCKIEEYMPKGAKRDELLAEAEKGLDTHAKFFDNNGEGSPFFLGSTFSYADVALLGYFLWFMTVTDDEERALLRGWSGGRWDRFLRLTEKYQVIV